MRVVWAVFGLLLAACVIETPPPEPPAQQATEDPEPEPAVKDPAPAEGEQAGDPYSHRVALESGFEYCCGDDSYRLEIGCGYLEMRCYVRSPEGSWRRTYGRHCKRELGLACYLNGCDDLCK